MNSNDYQREYRRSYVRTANGLLSSIVAHQKYRAKKESVNVEYSCDDLYLWLSSNKVFFSLFRAYERSGFDRNFRPVIYRRKSGNFSLDNIVVGTMESFYKKRSEDYAQG